MKRALPFLIVLMAIAAGAFWYVRHRPDPAQSTLRAAEFAPADAAIFIEFPDVGRTMKRWEQTALRQLALEPEWQAAGRAWWQQLFPSFPGGPGELLAQWMDADPASAFLAITRGDASHTEYVAGFSYRGKRTAVKFALERWRGTWMSHQPNARSELLPAGGVEIETLTSLGKTLAIAYRDNWVFAASSVEEMKRLLARYPDASGSLARKPAYVEGLKQCLPDADLHAYLNPAAFRGTGPAPAKSAQEVQLNDLSYSLKLEGREMRGRLYLALPQAPKAPPLANRHSALQGDDTVIFGLVHAAQGQLWQPVWREFGGNIRLQAGIANLLTQDAGLEPAGRTFGAEISLVADWGWSDGAPKNFFACPVRDRATAWPLAEDLVIHARSGGDLGLFSVREQDGALFWPSKWDSTIALHSQYLFFTPEIGAAEGVVRRLKNRGSTALELSPAFQAMRQRLPAAASGEWGVDLAKFAQRFHFQNRGWRKLTVPGVSFSATVFGQSLDVGFMQFVPAVDVISRHLAPVAAVHYDVPGGILLESIGPLPIEAAAIVCCLGGKPHTVHLPTAPLPPPPAATKPPAAKTAPFPGLTN
jgi:hypothetical protein